MADIVINKKTYEHCFFRGTVVGATKQLETKVSGGGGGGASYQGTGMKFIPAVAGIAYWWYRGIAGRRQLIASGRLLQIAGVQ